MPQTLKYNTIDVFTDEAYSGNPLAIVHVPASHDAPLTQEQKQRIAKEFNYSETTFLHPPQSNSGMRQVDIFTPQSEIPFAGHPTIGVASFVFKELETDANEISLALKAGPVRAGFERQGADEITKVEIPHNVHLHAKHISWEKVVAVHPELASASTPVRMDDYTFPIMSIVNGMNFALIDLSSSPQLLDNVKVTSQDLFGEEDLDDGWDATVTGALFFTRQPEQDDEVMRIKQRVIVIGLEDPATGSASCALCAFLTLEDKKTRGSTCQYELEQGVQMGRRSVISCEVTLVDGAEKVEKIVLSGKTVSVMTGEILV
jgi:PhzF family phenazine biosynthesis protein